MQQNENKGQTTVDRHLCQYGTSSSGSNQGKEFSLYDQGWIQHSVNSKTGKEDWFLIRTMTGS